MVINTSVGILFTFIISMALLCLLTHIQEKPDLYKYLLPPRRPGDEERKCVIIDLDETLVHSSFKVS